MLPVLVCIQLKSIWLLFAIKLRYGNLTAPTQIPIGKNILPNNEAVSEWCEIKTIRLSKTELFCTHPNNRHIPRIYVNTTKAISHISAYQLFVESKPRGMEKASGAVNENSQWIPMVGRLKLALSLALALARLKHASLPIHLCNKNTMDKSF